MGFFALAGPYSAIAFAMLGVVVFKAGKTEPDESEKFAIA
jgi:hypothetical protein